MISESERKRNARRVRTGGWRGRAPSVEAAVAWRRRFREEARREAKRVEWRVMIETDPMLVQHLLGGKRGNRKGLALLAMALDGTEHERERAIEILTSRLADNAFVTPWTGTLLPGQPYMTLDGQTGHFETDGRSGRWALKALLAPEDEED
jgi:hypothetical protein